MSDKLLRIAMWSGPRNMSTTMMRSFGARGDTICVDEPFYAAYLRATGLIHPMMDEVFASQSSDSATVISALIDEPCDGARVFYQKQMTHHMVDAIPRDWMGMCRNVFLIRHPARVIASYARKMEHVSLEAIGFPQQLSLFQHAATLEGRPPLVIDSSDILRDPPAMMSALCRALGLEWTEKMLTWPPGPRSEDGAWAPHWYDTVWQSTGFGSPPGTRPDVPSHLRMVFDEALTIYDQLAAHRLLVT